MSDPVPLLDLPPELRACLFPFAQEMREARAAVRMAEQQARAHVEQAERVAQQCEARFRLMVQACYGAKTAVEINPDTFAASLVEAGAAAGPTSTQAPPQS